MPSPWKGKQRALPALPTRYRRDDSDMGSGAGGGIVMPLTYVGTTAYDASYTLPVLIGSNSLNASLQVDTGSSDLWIAAASCSSSPCNNVPYNDRYNPSSSSTSLPSGAQFSITYLRGDVSGPIVWDTVDIGGYSITNQALASAAEVDSELLSTNFVGLIGLALPSNSLITSVIPATTSSAPDGAQFTSNLFSLSPPSTSPAARFISLTLERPGSSTIPSLLSIGKHPPKSLVPQIEQGNSVQYSIPVASTNSQGVGVGQLFWKSSVNDITVWVDGQPRTVSLTRSGDGGGGGSSPTAILDSGSPLIFSTRAIANAIYGAIGVSPASDGNYYVDCKTPLNLTITLDGRTPITVHPLDLTTQPPQQSSSSNCVGLIQAADDDLKSIADMILGVPFLRNVYMVMAYQVPASNGSFPDLRPSDGSTQSISDASISNQLNPRLGLQGLTNGTTAMDEFHRVRVLGQPLDSGSSGSTTTNVSTDHRHISVGLDVLFGLIGFFVFCFALFGLRFCLLRRKYGAGEVSGGTVNGHDLSSRNLGESAAGGAGFLGWLRRGKRTGARSAFPGDQKYNGEYELTNRTSNDDLPSEDALRAIRFQAYINKERMASQYTTSSDKTRVDLYDVEEGQDGEMGWRKKVNGDGGVPDDQDDNGHERNDDGTDADWDPSNALDWGNRDTLVGADRVKHQKSPSEFSENGQSPERAPMMDHHRRRSSDLQSPTQAFQPRSSSSSRHDRGPSVSLPLLPHQDREDVGTSEPSATMVNSVEPLVASPLEDDLAESWMAGVGSGSRNRRLQSDSLSLPRASESSAMDAPTDLPNIQGRPLSLISVGSDRSGQRRSPLGPRQASVGSISSTNRQPS